jgi:hypothetical protein
MGATDRQAGHPAQQVKYTIVVQARPGTIDKFSMFGVIVVLCVLTHCIFPWHQLIVAEAV